jgi:glutathione S-transferase
MTESAAIAQFLESTYPDPPVPLTSDLGREIEAKARGIIGKAFARSVMPREIRILSPRSQEYFRRTREGFLGHSLEELLDAGKEEEEWSAVEDAMRAVGELMRTNKADGPFVLGAQPSWTDFFIAGSLQSARVVDEGVFQRIVKYSGFKEVYEACLPYMEKKD